MLNLSLKDDLLSTLGGEVTLEADSVAPPKPVWKAILSVRDTSRLQQTLNTLLAAAHIEAEKFDADGVTYSTVHIPSSTPPLEIGYAFVDGHLILASDRETVAEAVRLHKTGESLGKSKTFLAALPEGHSLEASAMLYQDPIAIDRASVAIDFPRPGAIFGAEFERRDAGRRLPLWRGERDSRIERQRRL